MASLLIGNGINYLGKDVVGWSDLLNSLIQKIGKLNVINTEEKPFLHLYEEIFTRAEKYTDKDEQHIKQAIADEISTMRANPYHQKIIDLPFENILTLNYDYNLTDNMSNIRNKEVKYSLKRYQLIHNKKIWHIHGELDNYHSIMLGYSHYMDSISNIQTYLNSSKKNEKNNSTWVDIFLTNDIYILGAGLDFEELDIWWLLSYRNRELLERKNDINSPAQNTKIIYIDIVAEEYDDTKMLQELSSYDEQLSKVKELVKAEIKKKKNEAKLSMLETFGVEIKTFILDSTENNYRNAYDDVLEYFAKNLIKDKS
jgi:hypothetical protein